ncbi:HEAT repeat domain-containing protein [Planctomycetota bacterium]
MRDQPGNPTRLARFAPLAACLLAGAAAAQAAQPGPLDLSAENEARCVKILRDALESDAFWPSMHAAEALTLAGHGDEVRTALKPRLPTETDDQHRCGLARELVRAGDLSRVDVLLTILARDDPYGHVHAAESLYKVNQTGDGRLLRAALDRGDNPILQIMAAAALARSGNSDAMPLVRRKLADDDITVARIAAWVLARLGDPSDVDPLRQTLKRADDPLSRCFIEHALAALGDAQGQAALVRNLSSEEPPARTYAAVFAGEIGIGSTADRLLALLDDPEDDVRIRAAQALLLLARTDVRNIASRRQLFIDDYLIASTQNLKRSFHPAQKHPSPVMVPEHPWEGVDTAPWPSVYLFGDVLWDEDQKIYRMWYTSATEDAKGQHNVLYATSTDGVRWHKPLDLGIVQYEGSGRNNILIQNCSAENVLRVDDEPDAKKRYQLFTYDRNVNAYAWRFSPDGLHWSEPRPVPMLAGMYDMGNVAYDDTRGTYVMAVKKHHSDTYRHPVLGKHPGVRFRRWLMTTSEDTVDWTPPIDLLGDFDELDKTLYMGGEGCAMLNTYGLSLHAYHGVYLAVQWMFRITDAEGFWNCHGGPMDGRLLFSRDSSKAWQIPTREFVIPRGPKGDWDWGMICGVANRPVKSPDGSQWWYYYGGWDGGHGTSRRRACVGIAKFRVDGFASLDTFGTEAVLTTTKLKFTGDKLLLNVDASGKNTADEKNFARVELTDADGGPLEGHTQDDCDPIHVNSVDHVVTWRGTSDVSKLAGRVIRVKIHMKGAELYALQFVGKR